MFKNRNVFDDVISSRFILGEMYGARHVIQYKGCSIHTCIHSLTHSFARQQLELRKFHLKAKDNNILHLMGSCAPLNKIIYNFSLKSFKLLRCQFVNARAVAAAGVVYCYQS